MKNLTTTKKLMAILTISVLASMAIPFASATSSPTGVSTPPVPSQCSSIPNTSWLGPLANSKMTVKNDEDAAPAWYWALDTYQKSITMWVSGTTYCLLEQYSGTWKTFAGALSPGTEVPEPRAGSGTFSAASVITFTDTYPFNPNHIPTTGSIGTFNFGGTKADILTPPASQTGDPTFTFGAGLYFGAVNSAGYEQTLSTFSYLASTFIFVQGTGVGYGKLWVSSPIGNNNFGDIITGVATPVVPSQCAGSGWSVFPTVNVIMRVKNDEDTGFLGYWALDNYQKSIMVWTGPTTSGVTTYCALVQYAGTFATYKGADSPETGVAEPSPGSGMMYGGYVATFTSSIINRTSLPLIGTIGPYNMGGTKADIQLGTYSAPQTGDTKTADWVHFYFGSAAVGTFNYLTWSWNYPIGSGIGFGNLWVNAGSGSIGDIVT